MYSYHQNTKSIQSIPSHLCIFPYGQIIDTAQKVKNPDGVLDYQELCWAFLPISLFFRLGDWASASHSRERTPGVGQGSIWHTGQCARCLVGSLQCSRDTSNCCFRAWGGGREKEQQEKQSSGKLNLLLAQFVTNNWLTQPTMHTEATREVKGA